MAQPLNHDAAREAVYSMRGYSYQVLSSVLAWVQLAEDQVLFLEGAEDFDIVGDQEAETVQVKDTSGSGNITLRTPSVLSAIGHYWEHRQRNRGRRVSFRYLTTSDVGQEEGHPFGQGVRGIVLWQGLKNDPDDARRAAGIAALKAFLTSESQVPLAVREFVRHAGDTAMVEELLLPIDWISNAPPSAQLFKEIQDLLVTHGAPKGIPAAASEKTLAPLYLEAWSVATKTKDRALTRADFIRLFDQNTFVSLPGTALQTLLAQAAGAAPQPSISTVISPTRVLMDPPLLPPRYHRRSGLLQTIRLATDSSIAILYGATGTGKTTTAAALCDSDRSKRWRWLDLRGQDLNVVQTKLTVATEYVERSSEPLTLVLDDLDAQHDPRPYEAALSRLTAIQRRRGTAVIITTAYELPPRLCQVLGFDAHQLIRMPPFSRNEVAAFLEERGCPAERRATLAAVVELNTAGHPQLVHARVAALELDQFPSPRAQDLIKTPHDVLNVQIEARRLLSYLDPASRELIYRLSLVAELLDRDRLMRIANAPPPITEPGNALDRLIGPWVEIVQHDIYRISPLVRSAGQTSNGEAWAESTHRSIARALLAMRSLTPSDISEILMHAVAARDGTSLARLSIGLASAERQVYQKIAEFASWFTLVALELGQQMPHDSPGSLFLARLLQYRIATATENGEIASKIAARFDEEFPPTAQGTSAQLSRFLFLNQMVGFQNSITYPLRDIIARGTQLITLADDLRGILSEVRWDGEGPDLMVGPDGRRDYAILVGWTLILRLKSSDDLSEVVHALEPLPANETRRILWALGRSESKSRMVLDQIWLAEHRAETSNWQKYRETVQRLYGIAQRIGIEGLARAAAKIIVRVTDEDLSDPDGALALYDEFAAALGEFPALVDARARVLSRMARYAEAVDLWRVGLPNWRADDDDSAPAYAHRDASLAAVHLGDWLAAANVLSDGSRQTPISDYDHLHAGLLIDAGFAFWKSRESSRAIEHFSAGVALLNQLQDRIAIEPLRSVQRRAGHTLMWTAAVTSGSPPREFVEPPPGFCSSVEPLPELPPLTPIDFIIAHLVALEQALDVGDSCWQLYHDRLRRSLYSAVRVTHANLYVERSLKELLLNDLLSAALDLTESLVIAVQHRDAGHDVRHELPASVQVQLDFGHLEMVRSLLLFGVYAAATRGDLTRLPLQVWREVSRLRGLEEALSPFLEAADGLFVAKNIDPWEATKQSITGEWSGQDLAAIAVSVANDTDPRQMVIAHALLVSHLSAMKNRNLVANDLASLISTGWHRLVDRPFLLRNPRHSVPELERGINSKLPPWAKTRAVLQASLQAVSLASDNPARITIETMPEE
jgi:hypothetical protein